MFLNIFFVLAAYLIGSLPFGVWVTRWRTGRDIRAEGSGHTGGTNVIRQVGWQAGALVAVLDMSKGLLIAWMGKGLALDDWTLAFGVIAVTVGHCYPVWANFKGGIGLATTGGILLLLYPLGLAVLIALLIACKLVVRQTYRSIIVAAVLAQPIIWFLSYSWSFSLMAFGLGVCIITRALSSWNRQNKEVWLAEKKAS